MARVATDTTDDVGGEVTGLRTVILAVSDLATVLASLVFVITKRTVQCSELAELIALEFILAFGNRRGLCNFIGVEFNQAKFGCTYSLDDVVDKLFGFVYLLFRVGHDQAMQILVLVARVRSVRLSFALFHRAFAADGDFGPRLALHLLQCVATRANEEADC